MSENIPKIRQAPNPSGKGRADFKEDAFDVLVHQKGYNVIWESSISCPCKLDGRGFMPTCVNCAGSGYVFINPIKTKMLIQSMNITTKYSAWSLEKIGIAQITTRAVDNVGDMDRITLTESVAKMSQIVRPKLFKDKLFAFTNYPIIRVIDVFLFKNDKSKLTRIPKSKYTADNNKLVLNKSLFEEDMSVSVRYEHPVQYYIIDISREVRESHILDLSKEKLGKLPVSAIGRRCHHVLRPDDFETNDIVNNSYDTNND